MSHTVSRFLNPDFATSTYTSGQTESAHFHKSFEVLIVLKGSAVCTIDKALYQVEAGEAIFIFPLQIHSFETGADTLLRRITFHEHLILTVYQSIDGRIPQHPVLRVSKQFFNLLCKRLESFFGAEPAVFPRITPYHIRMQVKGLLYVLSGELLAATELMPVPKFNSLSMEIAQYIADNYTRDISLHDIAEEKGYNYHYVSRLFNRHTNINFKKMLNQYRIQQAFSMLLDTDLPIALVGLECGFQSIRSFNHVCKEIYQKTPSEIRNGRNL